MKQLWKFFGTGIEWAESFSITRQAELPVPTRFRVYRNLHKAGESYSLQAYCKWLKGWRVVGYFQYISLNKVDNLKFTVNKNGRAKVLKNKCKNVHAFIEFTINKHSEVDFDRDRVGFNMLPYAMTSLPVTYNPYKFDSFQVMNRFAGTIPTFPIKDASQFSRLFIKPSGFGNGGVTIQA